MPDGLSPAASDLGLGDMLQQQVQGETDEQRKKRMAAQRLVQIAGPAASPAAQALFSQSYGVA